jgi:hypothetical protein
MSISLAIRTPPTVQPGTVTGGVVVVSNQTDCVISARLSIIGIDGHWMALEANEIALFPGQHAEVAMVMHPPCDPTVIAGRHRFAIRAVASHDAAISVCEETDIDVAVWNALQLGLRPRNTRGANRARTTLTIANRGNAPQTVTLDGEDDDDLIGENTPRRSRPRPR